jgi:hypothetical protein
VVKKFFGDEVLSRFSLLVKVLSDIEKHIPEKKKKKYIEAVLICFRALSSATNNKDASSAIVMFMNTVESMVSVSGISNTPQAKVIHEIRTQLLANITALKK